MNFKQSLQITWADLAYYSFFSPMMERLGEAILDSTPHLKKLVAHVGNIPQIKKYVETRPKTALWKGNWFNGFVSFSALAWNYYDLTVCMKLYKFKLIKKYKSIDYHYEQFDNDSMLPNYNTLRDPHGPHANPFSVT